MLRIEIQDSWEDNVKTFWLGNKENLEKRLLQELGDHNFDINPKNTAIADHHHFQSFRITTSCTIRRGTHFIMGTTIQHS